VWKYWRPTRLPRPDKEIEITTNSNESQIDVNCEPIRILGISGSLRKASFNSGLLRAAQELAPKWVDFQIFDIRDIPFYDGDLEPEGDPQSVEALKAAIQNSEAVVFATPEYNWGTSGVLKNAIDWASRDRTEGSLMGKPATIIGAEGRAGTARAQMQLHETLGETGALVMVKPGLQVMAFSDQQFDGDGNLIGETTRRILEKHLESLVRWTVQIVRPVEFVSYSCEMDAAAD
jgi:chromate reductase